MAYTKLIRLAAGLICCAGIWHNMASAHNLCAGLSNYKVEPIIGGQTVDLCKLDPKSTKALLVVNTASQCGYTPQYEGLEKLHQRFKAQGLKVLAIPANDFGQQEPGSNKEIAEFCRVNYGVSFTVASKLERPLRQDPLFAQLIKASGQAPTWNFHKYLITSQGKVQSFGSNLEPLSARLVNAIQAALQ